MKRFGGGRPSRSRTTGLRLFFATDLHGSTLTFRKALSAPGFYGADALVLGGDLTGKRIVRIDPTAEVGAQLADRAEREGLYLWRATQAEADEIAASPEAEKEVFSQLAAARIREWLDRAEEVLGRTGTPCVVIGGNDDPAAVISTLESHAGPCVTFAEGRRVSLPNDYELAGYGWSNRTPWQTPRETDEPTIARELAATLAGAARPERLILDVHVPPHGCVDVCPVLDTSVDPPRPVVKGGQLATASVGSTAVRDAVTDTQPLLALCGHVHEAHGSVKLGRTVVVNPGSEYGDGVLRGALIALDGERVTTCQLTAG